MKSHPLFEKHSDIFKIYSGYHYYLTKIFGDFFAFMICVLSSICLAIGIIVGALFMVALFKSDFGAYSILGSFVFMIAILKLLKYQENKRNNALTGVPLEKRMLLAKDVIDSCEKYLYEKNLEKNKVTAPVIDKFKDDLHRSISYLISDDDTLILKGFKYVYGNAAYESGDTLSSDLNSLKSKVSEKEQTFKEELSKPENNHKKDSGEERLSMLLEDLS
jgi:hypothetical protein